MQRRHRGLAVLALVCATVACNSSPASDNGDAGNPNTGPTTHALALKVQGSGTGRIYGAGIADCRTSCTVQLAAGTRLVLIAAAEAGSTFAGWSGACTGQGDCTVVLDADRAVTATFSPLPPPPPGKHLLTVARSGSGTVTSSPSGIDCGTTCSAAFEDGTAISLSAVPASGFHFTGFSGACSGTTCTVALRSDALVQATFEADSPPPPPPGTHTLSVTRSGSGAGTVTSAPAGIDCGSACSASFADGSQVALMAAAASGSRFAGWSGACSGTDACTLTLRADASVEAAFENIPPPPPPQDDCATLEPPQQLPPPVSAQITLGLCSEDECGSGTSDGSGHVALIRKAFITATYRDSHASIYDTSGAYRATAGAHSNLQLFEQLEGFEGLDSSIHSRDVLAISPDGAVSRPRGEQFGWHTFVLDPLGGGVSILEPYVFGGGCKGPCPDVFLESYDPRANLRWSVSLHRQNSGVGVDRIGAILLLFAADGRFKGQWVDRNNGNLGPVFDAGAAPPSGGTLVPRVGSGFLVQGQPNEWLWQIDSGSTQPSPPPAWSPRPGTKIHMAFGGRAYAFIDLPRSSAMCTQQIEIVAPSGKSCGTMQFPIRGTSCKTGALEVGYDGSVVQQMPDEATPPGPDGARQCAWRWWTGVLGAR